MPMLGSNHPPRPTYRRTKTFRTAAFALIGAVIVVALVANALLPPVGARSVPGGGVGPSPPAGDPAAATLAAGAEVAVTSPTFWGIAAQTAQSRGIVSDPALGTFLNASPFRTFSYSQQPDQCNITTGTFYIGSGGTAHPCGYNMTEFRDWCDARGATCTSIVTLPGENNNSAEDAYIAQWIVRTVGFQPTYWTIGNEPSLWTHYGIPWSKWTASDSSKPTPIAYAVDVRNAIHAVAKVDPGARFLGIEADCQCSPTWFAAVGQVDGSLISGIAYHTYPSTARSTNETLSQLFQPLVSRNISKSYALVRSYFSQDCGRCATLPIFVTEYNTGPGWAPSEWAGTYPDAVFLAASATQALRANVTAFDIYYLQSDAASYGWGMINNTNVVGPEGVLYEDLLAHVTMGQVLGVSVASSVGNVWAVETVHGTHASLLIVNANVTRGITLDLGGVVVPSANTNVTSYAWQPGRAEPLDTSTLGSPGSLLVPTMGILLVDWTTGPAPPA
jgi:hypothetical protein